MTVLLTLLSAMGSTLRAEEGCVDALYQRLLAGKDSKGFVAFERHLIYPAPPAGSEPRPDLSREGKAFATLAHHYYCFLWDGPKFVMGFSESAPITNETNLAAATRLSGYDGEVYWKLNSVRTYLKGKSDEPPMRTSSILTIIRKDESKPGLSSLVALAAESRRVAQIGFSFPLAAPPTMVRSNLMLLKGLDGVSQTARITGTREHPETLEYLSSSNAPASYLVTIDAKADTLTIDRLSASRNKPTSTIRYKVLGSRVPSPALGASAFSWQTYRQAEGELIRQ